MNKKYIIKALSRYYPEDTSTKNISYIEVFFYQDSQNQVRWIRAGSAVSFASVSEALYFAKKHGAIEKRPTLGADTLPWIEGPKGGRYSIFTGRPL